MNQMMYQGQLWGFSIPILCVQRGLVSIRTLSSSIRSRNCHANNLNIHVKYIYICLHKWFQLCYIPKIFWNSRRSWNAEVYRIRVHNYLNHSYINCRLRFRSFFDWKFRKRFRYRFRPPSGHLWSVHFRSKGEISENFKFRAWNLEM